MFVASCVRACRCAHGVCARTCVSVRVCVHVSTQNCISCFGDSTIHFWRRMIALTPAVLMIPVAAGGLYKSGMSYRIRPIPPASMKQLMLPSPTTVVASNIATRSRRSPAMTGAARYDPSPLCDLSWAVQRGQLNSHLYDCPILFAEHPITGCRSCWNWLRRHYDKLDHCPPVSSTPHN